MNFGVGVFPFAGQMIEHFRIITGLFHGTDVTDVGVEEIKLNGDDSERSVSM